jgi:hypothetical protein
MENTVIKRCESRRINVLKRMLIVQDMVTELYEPGNQSKSKAQAYRKHINKLYPMGERTFWRYMGTDVEKEMKKATHNQLVLEF